MYTNILLEKGEPSGSELSTILYRVSDEVIVYSNSRLKVLPYLPFEKEMIVSRDKVNDFKNWLSGGH